MSGGVGGGQIFCIRVIASQPLSVCVYPPHTSSSSSSSGGGSSGIGMAGIKS